MADWVDVAGQEDLTPGSWRVVDLDDVRVAVFNIEGEFYAIEDVCTHDGEELTGGDVEGDKIYCPRHGACFDLRTGEALSAPAYEPVATFPVRVSSGVVQVRDNRDD